MTKKTKTILIIILVLLIITSIFVYYIFFSQRPIVDNSRDTVPPVVKIKNKEERQDVFVVVDKNVLSYKISDGKIRYITQQGKIFDLSVDSGLVSEIPFLSLQGLYKSIFLKNPDQLINFYSDIFGKKIFYYDLKTRKTTPLNKYIKSLDYSEENNKIVYHYLLNSEGTNVISMSDPDGGFPITLAETRMKDIKLKWINKNTVEVSSSPSGVATNIIYLLDTANPKLIKVLDRKYGMTSLWSKSGDWLIFSQTDKDGYNLSLNYSDKTGIDIKELYLVTLPQKCVEVVGEDSLVCAVFQKLPKNVVMPDDYYKGKFVVNDEIWKVYPKTGKKELIHRFADDKEPIDAVSLQIKGDELYFINRNNGFLYKMKLSK